MPDWRLPRLRHPALAVWRRNVLVWRRLLGPAIVMNMGEPLLMLLGLGYGLGLFIGQMDGMPYLTYVASGIVASSCMNSASFEAMYSVHTRMVPQQTYASLLVTPLEVDDILAGEMLWGATKGTISGVTIILVAGALGHVHPWTALPAVPALLLVGLCFTGPALVMSALSPSYDFFNYYQTLALMPMFVLSGVFYPTDSLPQAVQWLPQVLPLSHAVALLRPLVAGQPLHDVALHGAVLALYAASGYYAAVVLVRRRLLV